jgi:protein ImuB
MSRTIVVWCPDWPFVASGLAGARAAVLKGNRVVACSRAAGADGVRAGQRRREAESFSPGIVFVKEDPARDVRAFEPVVKAVSYFSPYVEVTRPGLCSISARGPSRYFGGEERLCVLLTAAASEAVESIAGEEAPRCSTGVADTPFAARLAARASAHVPPGRTPEWLSGFPVEVLPARAVVELLVRLGIRHLGQFAVMEEATVSDRFGLEGVRAHRLARGVDGDRLLLSEPPPDLSVQLELDEPVEQVETASFLAAGLADELVSRLVGHGLACTRLLVEASTEHGEELSRLWGSDRPFTARAMVDRLRWQLEGWLSPLETGRANLPTAGITLIRLAACEVSRDSGRQLGFCGDRSEGGEALQRAAARVQGLLGHESIGTAVIIGGRTFSDQVRFVPWGEPRGEVVGAGSPWPGRIPPPAPSVVYREPSLVSLRDPNGQPVEVSGRGQLSGRPSILFSSPGRQRKVTGWAGPWPVEERWWDPSLHRRQARMQVELEDGSAHVLALERGRWAVEASFD